MTLSVPMDIMSFMLPKYWHYVAPHRVRSGNLALPKCESWEEIQDLNLQRFARTLEFQGCVAFVGSGASLPLGYPKWKGLLPEAGELLKDDPIRAQELEALRKLIQSEADAIGCPEAFEIAQDLLTTKRGDRETSGRDEIINDLRSRFEEGARRRELEKGQEKDDPPLPALLDLPIRRFITTNYDYELEKALKSRLGPDYDPNKSFAQDDLENLAIFTVALARKNRNMVFHCHGVLPQDAGQAPVPKPANPARSTLVLTDEDYKYWYLSDDSVVFTFQRCLEVLLQSNPLFFVGYSLSDSDLVRILRHLSISEVPRRVASNAFALIRRGSDKSDLWCRAQQIKFGINLISYDPKNSLAEELERQRAQYEEIRAAWRRQPRAKRRSKEPITAIQPRPGKDLLFQNLGADKFLKKIHEAVEKHPVVVLLGNVGSGKYVKVCQFLRSDYAPENEFVKLVFSSHGNEDIYAYLKRIVYVVGRCVVPRPSPVPETTLVGRLRNLLDGHVKENPKKLLLVIGGIDLFLDFDENYDVVQEDAGKGLPAEINAGLGHDEWQASGPEQPAAPEGKCRDRRGPGKPWAPRNALAGQFMELLREWPDKYETGNRILLTARSIPRTQTGRIECIHLRPGPDGINPFPREQLELEEGEYNKLTWELQDQHYALIIAAAHIVDFDARKITPEHTAAGASSTRESRLNELLHILSAHSSERGTRVVRHIIRALDRDRNRAGLRSSPVPAGQKLGRKHELLLTYLSCFNTPITKGVINACFDLPTFAGTSKEELDRAFGQLIQFRLLYAVGPQLKDGGGVEGDQLLYVVPDVVKRYCRMILAESQHPEKRACGVHGLLSRGPFNDPGKPRRARELFDHFATLAFNEISKIQNPAPGEGAPVPDERAHDAQLFTRAALDILRSNFACNSVPQWGSYHEYVEMCSFSLDLVKNLAWKVNDLWQPGEKDPGEQKPKFVCEPRRGTASPEEMISLYNELGLAYYNEGALQDALSVWKLAFEWQKALAIQDPEQGVMYSASLNSHLGMANMQMGRMAIAQVCIEKAAAAAQHIRNMDLGVRMRGMLARIDHFRGSVDDARRVYEEVVNEVGSMGNRRAQSYFMRHWASLRIRMGELKEAEHTVRSSMAIAASENCADMVAFCRELLAKIYSRADKPRDAIREYRVTLTQARKLGIARLQADALLGLAKVQLGLGDATAARTHAIDALKIANENLLVLRQIKALVIIGQAAAQLGAFKGGVSCLRHAGTLASDSEFRLTQHDAEEALAELRIGSETRARWPFKP